MPAGLQGPRGGGHALARRDPAAWAGVAPDWALRLQGEPHAGRSRGRLSRGPTSRLHGCRCKRHRRRGSATVGPRRNRLGKKASAAAVVPTSAPQVLQVDVWAVGILIYELICGRPPFEVGAPA